MRRIHANICLTSKGTLGVKDEIMREMAVEKLWMGLCVRNEVGSIVATLACRWGRYGLVSPLRSLNNDVLATLGPFWRIFDVIVSRQAGDFVPTQIRVRLRRSAILD